MKVLIICSGNAENFNFKLHQSFIYEQIESIKKYCAVEYETFFINEKGLLGYLKAIFLLRKKIRTVMPDIIHAHFGLSGLVSCFQHIAPVVITFHGSDAYIFYVKWLSKIAASISAFNIFVEQKIRSNIKGHGNYAIIPCGINLDLFYPMNKNIAREMLGLNKGEKYIVFSSRFDNVVKNYVLAKAAIELLDQNVNLLELKNRSREEVNLILNACDLALLTSTSEGSPQFIKEALACNCPIVATDVGDIKELVKKTEGCFITSFDPKDVANKIELALKFGNRTDSSSKILQFDNKLVAQKIYDIYKQVLNTNE